MFEFRRAGVRQVILDDYPTLSKRRRYRRRAGYAIALLTVAVLCTAWHQAHAGRHDAAAMVMEQPATAGQLLLKSDNGADYQQALMLHSAVHFTISGMVSHASLTQSFRNDTSSWVEAVYVFPLPDKAAVNHLRMTIADRVIEGSVTEREQAKAVYLNAKSSGRKASLLEQQRPNMFTTKVANIAPGETIVVNIDYLQTVEYEDGLFSLRFPMTITPRYMPGFSLDKHRRPVVDDGSSLSVSRLMGWATDTDQVTDASLISPFMIPNFNSDALPVNPIAISVTLDMGMAVKQLDSSSHTIVAANTGHRYKVRLRDNSVSMDRDFVLRWRPDVAEQPAGAVFSETIDGEDYALMMIVPPYSPVSPLPKEVTYIIDTSGSMGGASIRQAKEALILALEQLKPVDRFNIIEFNSQTHRLFPIAQAAGIDNIEYARQFVSKLTARGGTEMRPALEAALNDMTDDSYLRQIIFITDGAVGNEQALLGLIHNRLANSRLFTVAIGSAPNTFFMRKAAQFGRGTLTHISSVTEVKEQMSLLFAKLNSPVASNLSISWPGGDEVEAYPAAIPDLYLNEPLLVTAKLSDISADIVVSGDIAGHNTAQPWQMTLVVPQDARHKGIATLWAREKIASLLDEKIMGRDEQQVRADVLPVALAHQLLSPYTSFVAVEKTPARSPSQRLLSRPVPNAQPNGQTAQHFAYPRTATTSMQSIVYGIALLVMAMVFFNVMRADEYRETAS